ncbi:hypothetical protein FGK63_19755 [Ruegeria sediminis]|uniref:Bile acid:sodium symporter family protein n=1 Tax=Ruegeria sediminis TaxID=2583820 RepID=A0ABY2WT13_9RHOB|nr:hypothetical protein [Ruegeria sediminis]TMV03324.1 hypothetical protein FGK63_19755 [Ruegeria sediminis]
MLSLLTFVARHGKLGLIAGLVAGIALPGLAGVLRYWIPEMVAFLLFLTAFRIGPRDTIESLDALRRTATAALVLQLALPLIFLALLALIGLPLSPLALAVALMLAAPSVTGAANFAILLGHDPAPALRLLILGTAVLPLTCIPVFALLPQFGALASVLQAAARLLAVILAAAALGFALRHWGFPTLTDRGRRATDGLTVIALAIIVIGLMSAIRPAFERDPFELAFWLAAAFGVNFGMQLLAFAVLRARGRKDAVPTAIVAGNRNFALFFVALPPETTDPLLIFLGCYQFPMYLTPTLLRRLYDPR